MSGQVGRYQVVRRLASGGMAEVYLARVRGPHGFARSVVLKRIRPELARDGQFQRMFADEARVAAHLQHLNIAQVLDVGEEDGEPFLVMEYVEGRDVHALLEDAGGRGLPIEIALAIALGVAAGLDHAHGRRDSDGRPLDIVHRDVSPSNVMVGFDGNVKLLDFGVAKARHARDVTRAGTVKGKAEYMSPEQARGLAVDLRSDLYSLGVLLYELLVGARPESAGPGLEPPGERRGRIPHALDDLVMRLLAREPAGRPASADAVSTALDAIAREERLSCSPVSLRRYLLDRFGEPDPVGPAEGEGEPGPSSEPCTASVSVRINGPATAPVTAVDEVDEVTGAATIDASVSRPRPLVRRAVFALAAAGALVIGMVLAMDGETNAARREMPPERPAPPAAAPVVDRPAEPVPPAAVAPSEITLPPEVVAPAEEAAHAEEAAAPARPSRRRRVVPKREPAPEVKVAPPVEEWDPDGPLLRSQERRIRQ